MSLKEKINEDLKTAMKEKDKETLSVLRMVKADMQLKAIDKKDAIDDNDIIAIISKQIKTRRDSNQEFEKGNRQDLIEKNNSEISILNRYMPRQMDSSEIEKIIDEKIKETYAKDISDMGPLMKILKPIFLGKADMSTVSEILRNKLK